MAEEEDEAQVRANRLHGQEEAEKAIAATLPDGPEKDERRMRAERLSDTAWSIEEAHDLDPHPSGLWPDTAAGEPSPTPDRKR